MPTHGSTRVRLVAAALLLGFILASGTPRAGATGTQLLPPSFREIDRGPAGGTVSQGLVPNSFVRGARRPTLAYLPPNASASERYPVLYLLQGFRGSPYQYADGLRLAQVADRAIAARKLPPFIAVMPPAGLTTHYRGEWTGAWEDYLVDDVIPWVDRHLPALRSASARAAAGLSAGGYGAVDIGLRHPGLFGTLEAWSGYFKPIRDGSLARAGAAALAAHNPSLLVARSAPLLRRLGTRFFLSSGTRDRSTTADTAAFARELSSLELPHMLLLRPGGHDGVFWRAQLPAALQYALGATRR